MTSVGALDLAKFVPPRRCIGRAGVLLCGVLYDWDNVLVGWLDASRTGAVLCRSVHAPLLVCSVGPSFSQPCRSLSVHSSGALQYTTQKSKKNTPERIEMKKYNKYLRRHTLHREIK